MSYASNSEQVRHYYSILLVKPILSLVQVQFIQAGIANTTLNSYEKSDLAYDAMKEAARDRIDAEKKTKKALSDLNTKVDAIEARVKGKLKLEWRRYLKYQTNDYQTWSPFSHLISFKILIEPVQITSLTVNCTGPSGTCLYLSSSQQKVGLEGKTNRYHDWEVDYLHI